MLDINPMLLLITFVVFIFLISILNNWLYRPLFSYMKERDSDIKKDLNKVSSNDTEIQKLLSKANTIIDNAKKEASITRNKAIHKAKVSVEEKLEAKRNEFIASYLEFETNLQKSKIELINSLKSDIPMFEDAIKVKFSQI